MYLRHHFLASVSLILGACSSDGGSASTTSSAANDTSTTADTLADAEGDHTMADDDAQAADAQADDAQADDAQADDTGADTATADDATADDATADDATADAAPPTPTYQTIALAQAKALLEGDPKPLLINVHIPFEGEIVGTDLHISYTNLKGLEAALGDKGRWAILYCKTGPMSAQAVKKLVSLGYWNLLDMPEGFAKWMVAGYPFSQTKAK